MTFQRSSQVGRVAIQISQAIALLLEEMDLFVQFGEDIRDWGDAMRGAEAIRVLNPAFDPDYCALDRTNSHWVAIVNSSGDVMGCIASKMMRTNDYVKEVLGTGALWHGRRPNPDWRINLVRADAVPMISGSVAYHGGFWLHPSLRGHGLARLVPRMSRAMAVTRYRADWDCGLVFEPLGLADVPCKAYGYTNCELIIDGWVPLTNLPEKLYLPWESRFEWTRASIDWMKARIRPSNHQFIDGAATQGERQDQSISVADA